MQLGNIYFYFQKLFSEILSQATSDTEVDRSMVEDIVKTYASLHPDYDQLDETYQVHFIMYK